MTPQEIADDMSAAQVRLLHMYARDFIRHIRVLQGEFNLLRKRLVEKVPNDRDGRRITDLGRTVLQLLKEKK